MRRLLGLLACLGTVGCATTGIPVPAPEPVPTLNADNAPDWLREATVTLVRGHHRPFCTGAVTLKANLILTAAHCVPEEGRIHVRLHDGRVVHARIVAHDAARDVAVLRTRHPLPIQPLPLAPSNGLRCGWMAAVHVSPRSRWYCAQTTRAGPVIRARLC